MSDLDVRPKGCVCPVDGPHIVWSTECPVHWELAAHIAREAWKRYRLDTAGGQP